MVGKTIVILGGGVGGLVASHDLRKRLGREHKIVLVDKETRHVFAPSFTWVMLGWRDPSRISRELGLLKKKWIEYVNAEALEIDPGKRIVKTSAGDFAYDYLIVALGAELSPQAVPGLSEAAYTPYSLEGSGALRDALKGFEGGRVAVVISALPFKCPAAPYETALLLEYAFRQRGIRSNVDLRVFTPEQLPMPVAGPAVGAAIKQFLDERDIGFHPQHKISSVDPGKKEIAFENGQKTVFDLLVAVPPHRSPEVVRKSGLANEAGWIPVDRGTMKTRFENVFALGDVTSVQLPGRYNLGIALMLPKAGVFAHFQASAVADNIASGIKGGTAGKVFSGRGYCFLETGHGMAGYGSGNFYGEPQPAVTFGRPGRLWRFAKVLFEKWWLYHWF
ncbi:MAG: FAD-dependent pyridine nucleotide-disulfide oxidoreductase [Actinobacteria bacterium]|nr:FAD-dependent pyridine nucleotide-disulfide oxidoreductase [Actinomycetota bacterium]